MRHPLEDPTEVYEIPLIWTGAHVLHRLIRSFEVLFRLGGRVAPKGYGSGWPGYRYDWSDQLAQKSDIGDETQEEKAARIAEEGRLQNERYRDPPTPHELSLMDEAFLWPVKFIGPNAKEIAIMHWSRARARDEQYEKKPIKTVYDEAMHLSRCLQKAKVVVR
jgi:hypothetical protein